MSGPSRFIGGVLAALRAGWRPLLALTAVGALAGLGYGLAAEPEYASTATAVILDRGEPVELVGAGAIGGSGPAAGERLLELARSEEVAELAAASLGDDASGADLLARTSFRLGDRGGSLVVRSTAGFPDFASAAAAAFAGAVVEVGTLLERRRLKAASERTSERLAEEPDPASERALELQQRLDAITELQELGPPLRPGRDAELPLEPEPGRSVPGSALAGAGLGALLALLLGAGRELYRRPLRRPERLQRALGDHPVVSIGPTAPRYSFSRTRGGGVLRSEALDNDRMQALADAAGLGPPQGRRGALAVVSPMPGEGRTTVALGLAIAIARRGGRVLLLEADMRRPALARRLRIEEPLGLSDYLLGSAAPRQVIRPVPLAEIGGGPVSFVCVTAGTALEAPAEILAGSRFRDLIEKLQRVYDVILVDSAPLLPSGDGVIAAAAAGSALVCARAGSSRSAELTEAVERLGGTAIAAGALLGAGHSGRGLRLLPASGSDHGSPGSVRRGRGADGPAAGRVR